VLSLMGQIPEYRTVDRIGGAKLIGRQPLKGVVIATAQGVIPWNGRGASGQIATGEDQDTFQTVLLPDVFLKQRMIIGLQELPQKSAVLAQLLQQHLQC